MKDLAKGYPQLTADERFRLFAQAAIRGDTAELDRLNNTCPRKTYVCDDYAYTKRKTNFILLSLWQQQFLRQIEHYSTIALLVGLNSDEQEHHESADSSVGDQAMDCFMQAMRLRASRIEAWRRFCEKIGLPADFPPTLAAPTDTAEWMASPAERVAKELGDISPEQEMVDRHMSALCEVWTNLAPS
jgi:hypothetical protein